MSPTVRLALAALGAVLFWAWTIHDFVAGLIVGDVPEGGGPAGRLGAFTAVVLTGLAASAFVGWALVAWKSRPIGRDR